jgi:hypothetical protein
MYQQKWDNQECKKQKSKSKEKTVDSQLRKIEVASVTSKKK